MNQTTEIDRIAPSISKKELRSIISILVDKTKLEINKELKKYESAYPRYPHSPPRDAKYLADKVLNSSKYNELKIELQNRINNFISCSIDDISYQLRITTDVNRPVTYCSKKVQCLTVELTNRVVRAITFEIDAATKFIEQEQQLIEKLNKLNSKLVDAIVVEYQYRKMSTETGEPVQNSITESLKELLEEFLK